MITSLVLKSFQAHRQFEAQLEQVNTIIGPSDVGKSAIVRAFRWLAFNTPQGEAFIRDGDRRAEIRVEFDGHVVTREKGAGQNRYTLDEKEYTAFGTGVPVDVERGLQLAAINFQAQHDSPFWFAETAGEVSRQLNSIINLGVIDDTLRNLASVLNGARAEVRVLEGRVAEAKQARDEKRGIRRIDVALRKVETLQATATETAEKRSRMARTVEGVVTYRERAERASGAVLVAQTAVSAGLVWEQVQGARERLTGVVDRVRDLAERVFRPVPDLGDLEQLRQDAESRQKERSALASVVNLARSTGDRLRQAVELYEKTDREFTERMGKRCALCGQTIRS